MKPLHEDMKRTFDEALKLAISKNSDYTGHNDQWGNLTAVEKLGIATTEQGIIIRMVDKIQRLASLTVHKKEQQVLNESIHDTLLDIINYAAILDSWLQTPKEVAKDEVSGLRLFLNPTSFSVDYSGCRSEERPASSHSHCDK